MRVCSLALGLLLAAQPAGQGASADPLSQALAPPGKASHAAALRAKALELGYNLDHEQALETFKESIAAATLVITLAAAVFTAAFTLSLAPGAARPAVARDTLAASFASDLKNVVYEWDPADPTPESVRRQALFDFVYETYDASAWIPQSLFDGNAITQAIAGDVDTIVGEKVGLVLWRGNKVVPAFGMAPNTGVSHRGSTLRWTVNCLVCHTAEIDGVAYLGAGTKTFDELWLGEALKKMTSRPVAADARPRFRRCGDRRRCPPYPEQPSSRQDRLAHARAIDGIRRIACRALHAAPSRRDAAGRRRRPRRRQDAAAVAHRGEDAGRPLVRGRQLPRPLPADGVVDGAGEGQAVRCARAGRRPAHQERVRVGRAPPAAASISLRDRPCSRRTRA